MRISFPKPLNIRVDPELHEAIEAGARRDRTTVSEFLRRELRSVLASADPRQAQGRAVHHG